MSNMSKIGWVVTALFFSGIFSADAMVVTSRYVTGYTMVTNAVGNKSVLFSLSPTGVVEVVPFAPDVVRVRFHFSGLYEREEIAIDKTWTNWPAFSQSFSQPSATNFLIETSLLNISIVLSNQFRVHFYSTNGAILLEDVQMEYDQDYQPIADTSGYEQKNWPNESSSISNLPSGFKLRAIKKMGAQDAFFGLGDTAGALNRRGRAFQFWGQDTYQFGEGRTPKYTALPMMYGLLPATSNQSARAYGLFFNNPARPVFKLYGDNSTWSFEAGDDQLDYFFFGGGSSHSMPDVITRFSDLTGRPVMLPKWAMGYHQSRHSYSNQQYVLNIASNMRSNDFPCDAIYLDIGSQMNFLGGIESFNGGAHPGQLTFNSFFTNVVSMVNDVGDMGMKLIPLIEPLIATNDPLYPIAFSNLYFIKNNDLSTYVGTNFIGRISWLDFSITDTVSWWKGKMTNYLNSYGFEAIWNDLNEPNENAMPLDTLWFLDGRYGGGLVTNDSRKWHSNNKNTFNIWESRVTYDALRLQNPNKRPFVLSRGAWPGIQKYAAGWSGDNKSSFDHLRFNVPLGLSVMISGQAWFGHDVGGFVDDTTSELLSRWIQSGSLNPMFRNHTTLNTINQEPWLFGATETLWNRKWIKFRYQMMPYLYTLAANAATSGVPMNVPVVFNYQNDANTYSNNNYEYMVGRDLLVAPVYTQGTNNRSVYLPAGDHWYFWDTQVRYAGGQTVNVPSFTGALPLFSRAGAIIPMGPVQMYANEFAPDYLNICHWPGGTNRFVLYEDDGVTTNYLSGNYAMTPMTSVSSTNKLTFIIHARTGTYIPGARDYYVIMYDANPIDQIWVNSSIVSRVANRSELEAESGAAWSYSAFGRLLTVKIPDNGMMNLIEADFTSVTDTDGDGMPDDWEFIFFNGITNANATTDSDGDSRNNLAEYAAGKHPLKKDVFSSIYSNMAVAGTFTLWNQKADNMYRIASNRWGFVADLTGNTNIEFKFVANNDWGAGNWGDNLQTNFTPPMNEQLGFPSAVNIKLNGSYSGWYTMTFNETNLRYSVVSSSGFDIDGDGMSDEYEAYYGLNPYSAADALFDVDGDDFTELQEFIAGTSLVDPESYHSVTGLITEAFPGSTLFWTAVSGRQYSVMFSTNLLESPVWSPLAPYTNLTGIGPLSITDTSTLPFKAFRVDVKKP